MSYKFYNQNFARVSGEVCSDIIIFVDEQGKEYYKFSVASKRSSGTNDVITVLSPIENTLVSHLEKGNNISCFGVFKSRNTIVNGKNRLNLELISISISIELYKNIKDVNYITFEGFVCRPPVIRETPGKGTEESKKIICDAIFAVNHDLENSSYLPCIFWDETALNFYRKAKVGDKFLVQGRIQSRNYEKALENGNKETRTAMEVSCYKFDKIKTIDDKSL